MGKLTVDIKHKKLFVTMDKWNRTCYQEVKQGDSHIRSRPNNGRFSDPLNTERDGVDAGFGGGSEDFLGKGWSKMKGFKPDSLGNYTENYPSLNEIF
jgi:hypothetical protein